MKYLFVGLLYFCSGFIFPTISSFAGIVLALVLTLFTVGVVLNLYDEQFDLIPHE